MDGGSENNNTIMDTFCSSLENPIKKLVALKHIRFSNSMVEAVNKIVKYRFLYNVSLPDFNSLKKYLEKAIPLYNNVMPHGAIGGIPPVDVLNGKSIDKYNVKEKLENARKLRIIENRKANCGICE